LARYFSKKWTIEELDAFMAREELVVGEPAFRVAIMTWDKVRGQLSGDPADNIPFFYTGFAERVRRGRARY
jgi:hypothetical protein